MYLDGAGEPAVQVLGSYFWPDATGLHKPAMSCRALRACLFPDGETRLAPTLSGTSLAWITLSDKGAAGKRTDESGPLIAAMLSERGPVSLIGGR